MRAFVVEDIEPIREGLIAQIERVLDGVEVVGAEGTVVQAAKSIRTTSPDIIFLDIDLPDGTGFDLLDILSSEYHVIFVTGNAGHAVRAYQYAAIHYLVKPIDDKDLLDAFERVSSTGTLNREQLNIAREYTQSKVAPTKIALHTAEKIIYADVDDILRCEADGNYTRFYLKGRKALLVAKTLKEYSSLLEHFRFIRVHQSHLVNIDYVEAFIKTDGGYLLMSDGTKIPVATRKRTAVLAKLEEASQ